MRLVRTLLIMFIASFIIQYFLMSSIMTYSLSNVRNSLGKVYLSIIMGVLMTLVEILMHDQHYGVCSFKYYFFSLSVLGLMVYLYRTQKYINDKQYLEEMIEHHSMALLTSKRILEKTNKYEVTRLAKNIIQKQQDEIRDMELLLKEEKKLIRENLAGEIGPEGYL